MKLQKAIEAATDKLEANLPRFTDNFAGTCSEDYKYKQNPNNNWICGMHTGCYWLAYELTGNPKFRKAAENHLHTYEKRFTDKIVMHDHDVGFVFWPSCIAAYKVTGDEKARKLALDAAKFYYEYSYSQKGGFILRCAAGKDKEPCCRTMMDTLMNVPLLFWAGQETGIQEYTDAAISQNKITGEYLIRDDFSSFHHYQFEVGTHKPVRGLTLQGYSDDSCWARGQSWGVYGFSVAYSYTKDEIFAELQKNVTNYFLNKLPEDYIPYWDLIFTDGTEQPRDSSAAVISASGMLKMCQYLPDSDLQKAKYQRMASKIVSSVIDNCTGDIGVDYDGLICHVTHALPQKAGIDECAIYGDYFYLEALMRLSNPNWQGYC